MINTMIKSYVILLGCCFSIASSLTAHAQRRSLTLLESHAQAVENYPAVKQRGLIASSAEFSIERANTAYLPQLNINGQATYQSAVTQIPLEIPGIDIPGISHDQYKLYGEVNQSIYDGGHTRLQKRAIAANARVEEHALEVELYKVKERINQLFFGILLLDAQITQNELLKKDIRAGLEKTIAAIANGTALKSSRSLLEAELLKAGQRSVELHTTRKAYVEMLGLFINQTLDDHITLERPAFISPSQGIKRPELDWYAQQQNSIDVENSLLTAKNLPKLSLFLQGGLGRPALNMLSNEFEAYYYGGVRLNIPLSGFYTLQKERAQLDIKRKAIDVQRETFLFNTGLSFRQQHTESTKYENLLQTDDEIIALRAAVKDASLAQLENGVINTADYLREIHAEDRARLDKILHEIQLLMVQYNLQNITGN